MGKAAQYDDRQASYVLAVMSAGYALLLARLGIQAATIYPLALVFPE